MDLNLIAPINQLGYGIVGLNILKAALRAGHQVFLWPVGGVEASPADDEIARAAFERTRFFNPEAPCLRLYYPYDMAQMVGRGIHAGMAIFELNRLTAQQRHHLGTLDLVFVPSHWAVQVLAENGIPKDRARVAPFGVDHGIFNEKQTKAERETTFLNIGKWERRKGHDVLVEAFNRAFTENDPVRLVMNAFNPFLVARGENAEWEKRYLNSRLGRAGKITVLRERLPSQEDVAALIHTSDCGVFPARGEGWNLDMLEMLACGKHVIATNFSAHTEFLTPENARLIHVSRLEPAFDGFFFQGEGEWAAFGDDQMEQLIEHLRAVHRMKQGGQLGVNEAGIATSREFTWERTVACIVKALKT